MGSAASGPAAAPSQPLGFYEQNLVAALETALAESHTASVYADRIRNEAKEIKPLGRGHYRDPALFSVSFAFPCFFPDD